MFEYVINILKKEAEQVRASGQFMNPESIAYKESGIIYQELYEAVKILEKEGNK